MAARILYVLYHFHFQKDRPMPDSLLHPKQSDHHQRNGDAPTTDPIPPAAAPDPFNPAS